MGGNATLMSLVLILLVGTLALGAAHIAGTETGLVTRLGSNTGKLSLLVATADSVTACLSARDAAEPDTLLSPVYADIEALGLETGTIITLTDLSSRFNLNSLRKNMIEGTELASCIKPGMSAAAFQQYRENEGFSLNIFSHYGDYFKPEALAQHLTGWGYWNINTADEFSLERIFAIRTGNTIAAGRFHRKIREQLKNRTLISPDELEAFIGTAFFDEVFPAVNAHPPVNINTADEWVLKQLLSYEAFRVVSPSTAAASLLALRQARPLAAEELFDLIPVIETDDEGKRVFPREENRLFAWLGDSTWFWEIRVEDGDGRILTRVLARLPEKGASATKRSYRIVEEEIPW